MLNTRDVSERKRLEQELIHQAFHDPLTGLANRALFRDRVSHALALAQRQGHPITVLFLDLDDFKQVNDSLGHAEGDRLLIAAAERFLCLRPRAPTRVARLGGDEFAILIEHVPAPTAATGCWSGWRPAMAHPFNAERQPGAGDRQHRRRHRRPASDTADDLLRNADVAMYAAKRRGKGRVGDATSRRMYADVARAARARGGAPAARSSATSWSCTTSRSCTCGPARSTASRRWCAGTTPSSATSCRSTSSRWRRRPGSSCSWAPGC